MAVFWFLQILLFIDLSSFFSHILFAFSSGYPCRYPGVIDTMNCRNPYIIVLSFLIVSSLFCVLFLNRSFASEKCDNTAYDLIQKGRYLSEEAAKHLEQKLSKNPDDLSQRTKHLGYY